MTRSGLFLALVTLGVGALLGYLAGASGSRAPGDRVDGVAISDAPPARDVSRGVPDSGRATPVDEPGARDPLPAGTGRITGQVTLVDGTPLGEVVVRATPRGPRERKGRGPEELDLASAVPRFEMRLRAERESRRETTTDETGRYVLTGIADEEYRLEAFLRGYEIRTRERDRAMAGPGDTVRFLATPITDVRLSVLLPDGKPADRATLTYTRVVASRRPSPRVRFAWSSRYPGLQLGPGTWRFRAAHGRHEEFRSDEVTVVIEANVSPGPVILQLAERPGIRGRLNAPPGHPDLDVVVHALRVAPGAEVPDARVLADGEKDWLSTDLDTGYSFVDLVPGTWVVVVSMGLDRVVGRAVLEVVNGMVTHDFDVPPPEPGDYLILRVEAPDGTPLRDITIQTGYVAPHYSSTGGGQARLRPDGTYRVQHHDVMTQHREGGGKYVVIATSGEYGELRGEYDPGETPSLILRFGEPVVLDVRLAGFRDSPHESSLRLCLSPVAGAFSTEIVTPDAEGRHTFGPVSPGEYELLVGVKDEFSVRWVMKRPLSLKGGVHAETVVVPPLFELTVIAGDLAGDGKIGLRLEGGDVGIWIPGKVPTDGHVRFDRLPAGRYVLFSVDVEAPGEMVVVLGGTTTVRFAAQVMNAFHVRIRDPDGPLARAGLREGDLVLAIDGEEVVNRDQGQGLLTTARSKDSVLLTVRRGRGRLEIAVNPAKIVGEGAGGSLLPSPR